MTQTVWFVLFQKNIVHQLPSDCGYSMCTMKMWLSSVFRLKPVLHIAVEWSKLFCTLKISELQFCEVHNLLPFTDDCFLNYCQRSLKWTKSQYVPSIWSHPQTDSTSMNLEILLPGTGFENQVGIWPTSWNREHPILQRVYGWNQTYISKKWWS